MTERGNDRLRYDSDNQLVSYMGPALIETYGYDYTGFRVKKTSLDGINVKTVYNIGGLYEVLVRPGERDSHTKYIFGINGEIAAQITMDAAELVSAAFPIVFDAKRFIINPGSYLQEIAVRILVNAFVEAGDFINDIHNQRIIIISILILLSAVFLLAGAYYRIYRREESIFWLKWAADICPVILVAFLWVFGFSGCGALPDDGSPKEGMYFYHPDHIGSIAFLTDDDGNKVSQVYYKPYGEIAEFTGEDIFHYKYTSQEQDSATGLYYYNARFYDPLIGRFLTADSMVPDPMNSQSFNRYMYVKGNPVCYNDPSGHIDRWWQDYYTWLYSQNNTKDSTTNEGSSSQTGATKTGGDTKPGNISTPSGNGSDAGVKDTKVSEPKKDTPNISPNQHRPGGNPTTNKTAQGAAVNNIVNGRNNNRSTGTLLGGYITPSNVITSGFLERRIWKDKVNLHTGIDFKSLYYRMTGDPIYSRRFGIVTYIGLHDPNDINFGYGRMIIIKYLDGIEGIYAHIQSTALDLHVGSFVYPHQYLGEMGSTGWSTGAHLHYEERLNEGLWDPNYTVFPLLGY